MDWITVKRDQFRSQAQTFSQGIEEIGDTLGLSVGEIAEFAAKYSAFSDGIEELSAAKAAYEGALQRNFAAQAELAAEMRTFNRRMQGSAAINNGARAQIGLPIPKEARSIVRPKTVTHLVATPNANGDVKLKWNRNGNAESVNFNIEMSEDSVNWNLIENTSRTSIALEGFAPGVTKYFRIVAKRGKFKATASNPAVIYSGSQLSEYRDAA